MLSVADIVFLLLTSTFSVATVILYFSYLLEKRFKSIFWLIIPATNGLFVPTYCFIKFKNADLNFFIAIAIIISILLFFKPMKHGLIYAVFLEVIMLLADGLTFCILLIFSIRLDSPLVPISTCIITALFVFLFARRLKLFQSIDLPKEYSIAFMIIPLCSIGILFTAYSNFQGLTTTANTIVIAILVCFLNIVSIFLYSKIVNYFVIKVQSKALSCQIEANLGKQNLYAKAFKELNTLQHNMKNELLPVSSLLEAGDYKQAQIKINETLGNYSVNKYVPYSNISFIDDMINYKKNIADLQSIRFIVKSHVGHKLKINYIDLSTMLGIALDNAIEANADCTDKYVKIEIYTEVNAFIINISNCLMHSIIRDKDGKILSTKIDNAPHGIGLLSIKTLLEENCGEYRISTQGDVFKITLILFEL